jgi:hypothetical protein
MKPERLVQFAAGMLLVAGLTVWALGGAHYLRSLGVWLWVGAFAVMCTPLVLLLVERIWTRARRR